MTRAVDLRGLVVLLPLAIASCDGRETSPPEVTPAPAERDTSAVDEPATDGAPAPEAPAGQHDAGAPQTPGYTYVAGDGAAGGGGTKPDVRQAPATVTGELDRDIVRRIVHAHLNEIRHCYALGLDQDPELTGQVTIEFRIGSDGHVSSSAATEPEAFPDPRVPTCIANAAEKWQFPRPGDGGHVDVVYPFELQPG